MIVKHSVVMTVTVHVKGLATMLVTILVQMTAIRDAPVVVIAHVQVLPQVLPPHVRFAITPVREIVKALALALQRVQPHAQVRVAQLDVQINVLLLVDTHAMILVMILARGLLQDLHHALLVIIPVRGLAIQHAQQLAKVHLQVEDVQIVQAVVLQVVRRSVRRLVHIHVSPCVV